MSSDDSGSEMKNYTFFFLIFLFYRFRIQNMCRITDIACRYVIKNIDDPMVMETLITLLELYAKKTDNEIDDQIVNTIKKAFEKKKTTIEI